MGVTIRKYSLPGHKQSLLLPFPFLIGPMLPNDCELDYTFDIQRLQGKSLWRGLQLRVLDRLFTHSLMTCTGGCSLAPCIWSVSVSFKVSSEGIIICWTNWGGQARISSDNDGSVTARELLIGESKRGSEGHQSSVVPIEGCSFVFFPRRDLRVVYPVWCGDVDRDTGVGDFCLSIVDSSSLMAAQKW